MKVAASHTLDNGATIQVDARWQRQRPALLEANGNIYAAFGIFCHVLENVSRGWLLGWQAASLTPLASNQLNDRKTTLTVKSNKYLSSIWMLGSGIAADESAGIWWMRFRFRGRFVHESTRTKSKTLARDAERQRRRELETKWNRIERRSLPPTFERAAAGWMKSREHTVADNTKGVANLALKHLLPVFGSRLLCDIEPDGVRDYQKKRLREGAEGRTINIEVATLRQVLKANDSCQPFDGKLRMLRERHDLAKALTPEQEHSLLEAAAEADSACHTATLLALNTAMRKDEIRTLRWEQIDFEDRILTVGKSKTAGAGRLITLNPPAFEALVRRAGPFPGD